MKKSIYLFTGILATAILFTGCSTQTKHTTFGGGWGMEKNKGFQNSNPTAKNTNEGKIKVISTSETITINDAITQNKSRLTLEEKSYISAHKTQNIKIDNNSTSSLSMVSVKKPSIEKMSKLFPKKKKSSTGNDDEMPIWGIISLTSSFLGAFLWFIGIFGIAAIVFGIMSLNKKYKGIGIAGLILGSIEVIILVFFLLSFLLV